MRGFDGVGHEDTSPNKKMPDSPLEHSFPGLSAVGYQITSPASPAYNCIAWAATHSDRWWWPSPYAYWPPGVPQEESLTAFISAFEFEGFQVCTDAGLEPGYEKVAIYADAQGNPTHAARQLDDGRWTSKLGESQDIEHTTLAGLEGLVYGRVTLVLRRFRT